MATVRLDARTEATLKRLAQERGETRSEVIRHAIALFAEEEEGAGTAYQHLQGWVGAADSGGRQLSEGTGRRLQRLLEEKRRARRSG